MQAYWMKFTDGSTGHCEGQSAYDAVVIAEKITGKTVDLGDLKKWQADKSPNVQTLPYPRRPMIWQFDHPVHGVCPCFCYGRSECVGKTSCPNGPACSE
jgi:hypothetical protein